MKSNSLVTVAKWVFWVTIIAFNANLYIQHEINFSLIAIQYMLALISLTFALSLLVIRLVRLAKEGWPFKSDNAPLRIVWRILPYPIAVFYIFTLMLLTNTNLRSFENSMFNLGLNRISIEPALQAKIGSLTGYGFITAFYVNAGTHVDPESHKRIKYYNETYSCRLFGSLGVATANFMVGCKNDEPCQPLQYNLPD